MAGLFDGIIKKEKSIDLFSKINEKDSSSLLDKVIQKETEKLNEHIIKNADLGSVSGKLLAKNNVAIPYYFSQSAIYAPRSNKSRDERNTSVPIWNQGKNSVSYKGPELDTKIDYKLMSIVLKARDQLPADKHLIKLKYKETMKSLGLNPHHPDSRKKFHSSIERHLSGKLFFSVDNEKEGFWKPLFESDKTIFSYTKNILIIQLSDIVPKLFNFERKETFSIEDMLISFSINDSYAAKLYSYYESNKVPFAVKVSTILKICDHPILDDQKPSNNNRATVKKALNKLVEIGFLENWNFIYEKDRRDPIVVVKKIDKENRVSPINNFKYDFLDN